MCLMEFEQAAASLRSRRRVRPTATHCRCTIADTSKGSSGGPKNWPEGKTESSYFSLLQAKKANPNGPHPRGTAADKGGWAYYANAPCTPRVSPASWLAASLDRAPQVPCRRRYSRTGCGTESRVGYTVRRSASPRSGAVARPCAAAPVRESVFRRYSG